MSFGLSACDHQGRNNMVMKNNNFKNNNKNNKKRKIRNIKGYDDYNKSYCLII